MGWLMDETRLSREEAATLLERGEAEVVWVLRICPTRGRVLSVPFTDRRFGEIVVHDGAPNGERVVDGQAFPVFDELSLWQPSDTATWRAEVTAPDEADMSALSE